MHSSAQHTESTRNPRIRRIFNGCGFLHTEEVVGSIPASPTKQEPLRIQPFFCVFGAQAKTDGVVHSPFSVKDELEQLGQRECN